MSNKQVPNISKKFQNVYKAFLENDGNPKTGIKLADEFLEEVPYYPEALVFKARMLIAIGKNKKAIKTLELAEKFDKWRLIGKFDKAEAYLENDHADQSINEFVNAISQYQDELLNGLEGYLLSIADRKKSEKLKREIFRQLSQYWQNTDNPEKVLEKIKKLLIKNKKHIKPLR